MDIDLHCTTEPYAPPRVYELGAVRELTTWTKSGGSADSWHQQQGECVEGCDDISGAPTPH